MVTGPKYANFECVSNGLKIRTLYIWWSWLHLLFLLPIAEMPLWYRRKGIGISPKGHCDIAERASLFRRRSDDNALPSWSRSDFGLFSLQWSVKIQIAFCKMIFWIFGTADKSCGFIFSQKPRKPFVPASWAKALCRCWMMACERLRLLPPSPSNRQILLCRIMTLTQRKTLKTQPYREFISVKWGI